MQLFAKFIKILYVRFSRATLKFFFYRCFVNFNFVKSCILSCLSKFEIEKAGLSVAMVTYCVTKMILTCSLVIGHFLDAMIVASVNPTSTV